MKTAMLKTDLVNDDTFFDLNIDTKLLYLIILASPERGVGRIYKLGQRIQAFRTGLNIKQLEVCQGQLHEQGLVYFHEGYVYLPEKSSFVQPVKGKLTKITLRTEISKIPQSIIDYFRRYIEEGLAEGTLNNDQWLSGEAPEYVNVNDNDNDSVLVNVKDKDIKTKEKSESNGSEQAQRLANLLHASVKQRYNFTKERPNEIPRSAYQIDLLNRVDRYDWPIIEAVLTWSQNDPFWQQNIRSGSKLRQKFEELLIKIKAQNDSQKDALTIL